MTPGRPTARTLGAALALALALATPPLLARQDAPPTSGADASRDKALFVLRRHIRAIGGEDVIRAATDITFEGSVQFKGADFVGRVHSRRALPGRQLTRLTLGQMGTILQGYDGQTAWSLHPVSGPAILEGAPARSLAVTANPQSDLRYEDNYTTIEYLGDAEFGGEPAFAIRLTDDLGTVTTEYFSKGEGVRIGVTGERESPSGPVPFTRALSDYEAFENLRLPTRTVERFAGQEITVSIERVSFTPIPSEVFTPPEPVRALIDARDAPDDEPPEDAEADDAP